VPIPYPNTGMVNQAKKTAKKVKFAGKPVVTKKSEISRSMGDEAGVQQGRHVGHEHGQGDLQKREAPKLRFEGQPCVHLTCMSGHNGMNANMPAGAQVAPSQTKVIVSP
jgi:hypothetical protein